MKKFKFNEIQLNFLHQGTYFVSTLHSNEQLILRMNTIHKNYFKLL